MKQPALAPALFLVIGILATVPTLDTPVRLSLFALAVATLVWLHHRQLNTVLCLLALVAGALRHGGYEYLYLSPEISRHSYLWAHHGEARLKVESIPRQNAFTDGPQPNWSTQFIASIRSFTEPNKTVTLRGQVWVEINSTNRLEIELHDTFRMDGVLRLPPIQNQPSGFDLRSHLHRQGIYRVFHVSITDSPSLKKIESGNKRSMTRRFQSWASAKLSNDIAGNKRSLALIRAMALGDKSSLSRPDRDLFSKTGTMHLFAISGLHIGIITAILFTLLKTIRLPLVAAVVLTLGFIWFFVQATGNQPSAARAAVMASVLLVGKALQRPSQLLNALFLAASLLLLHDSHQLFQVGFQLSFMVVLGLALSTHFMQFGGEPPKDNSLATDGMAASSLKWGHRPSRSLRKLWATSLIAWLFSTPIIARDFGILTPVAVLINPVAIIAASLSLMSVTGSLISHAAHLEPLGILFNHAATLWMSALTSLCEVAVDLPFAWSFIPKPPLSLCFLLILSTLIWSSWKTARRTYTLPAQLLTILTVIALGSMNHWLPLNPTLTISSSSQGDWSYYNKAGIKSDLIIDTGRANRPRSGLFSWLQCLGMENLPHLILTHGDIHHTGGCISLLSQLPIIPEGNVFTPIHRSRSKSYQSTIEWLRRTQIPVIPASAGQRIGDWTVIHPQADSDFSHADNQCTVIQTVLSGVTLCHLSDLGLEGQRQLIERHPTVQADIVIASPTTRGQPLEPFLLETLQPQLILLTGSVRPSWNSQSLTTKSRLSQNRAILLTTEWEGWIELRATLSGIQVTSARGTHVEIVPRSPSKEGL